MIRNAYFVLFLFGFMFCSIILLFVSMKAMAPNCSQLSLKVGQLPRRISSYIINKNEKERFSFSCFIFKDAHVMCFSVQKQSHMLLWSTNLFRVLNNSHSNKVHRFMISLTTYIHTYIRIYTVSKLLRFQEVFWPFLPSDGFLSKQLERILYKISLWCLTKYQKLLLN